MSTPVALISDLATVILLLRDFPDRKEEQRAAFKRFVADMPHADHVLRVTPGGFAWDQIEVPVGLGEVSALHDHFKGHGVGEIRIPIGLMTSTLLSLVRVLAVPVGTYGSFDHLTARLDAAGCGTITVLPLPDPAESPAVQEAQRVVSPSATGATGSRPRVDDEGHLNALGPDALTEAKVGLMHFVTLQMQTLGPTDVLVHELAGATSDAAITDRLNAIIAAGEAAARQGDWHEVLVAAYGLVQLEGRIGEHRGFGIALRRLLPRSVLEQIARLTAQGTNKTEAAAVLRRMGADGTEVLLHAMVNAEEMAERRAYFTALKDMTEGTDLLVHMLSHDQWFVVRNVADLCGELRLEKAVPALAKQMGNSDERVRRSVAGALGRIGGSGAADPLRRALRDPAPGVRLEAARGLDGRRNKNLAMSVAVAADDETLPDVQKEMFLALGRIGSPEAIQALQKAAEPGGKVFRRKQVSIRLAAVAGLHAAGPSAANALKDMLKDDERDVRDAVERSLATLWE
ncbi:MAG TPA: HEAT repeat domain-containing protein [Gemmatimonadales bacterium]|nr:HEAT repeat domain-containing protein [Gemmatimonadales bacterium]